MTLKEDHELFDLLIFKRGDEFSWFIDNYELIEALSLDTSEMFLDILYVVEGTFTADARLKWRNIFRGSLAKILQ